MKAIDKYLEYRRLSLSATTCRLLGPFDFSCRFFINDFIFSLL